MSMQHFKSSMKCPVKIYASVKSDIPRLKTSSLSHCSDIAASLLTSVGCLLVTDVTKLRKILLQDSFLDLGL